MGVPSKTKIQSQLCSIFFPIQFGVRIKRIRSNNDLNSFCSKESIIHESSCVKTPQQNGIAKRKNGHLLDQTRDLLFEHKVPKSFCEETDCML